MIEEDGNNNELARKPHLHDSIGRWVHERSEIHQAVPLSLGNIDVLKSIPRRIDNQARKE